MADPEATSKRHTTGPRERRQRSPRPEAVPSIGCTEDMCCRTTNGGKPYCIKHIYSMPAAVRIAADLALAAQHANSPNPPLNSLTSMDLLAELVDVHSMSLHRAASRLKLTDEQLARHVCTLLRAKCVSQEDTSLSITELGFCSLTEK